MNTVKVVLTHVCHAPEYSGNPGDTVEVPAELANVWASSGGCKILPPEKPAPTKPVTASVTREFADPDKKQPPTKADKKQPPTK